jgi:DtxR family Mn-dependent transcriptional regulator
LIAEGFLSIEGTRDVTLTAEGRAVAEVLVRRHRLAERMLVDILGIQWHLCHEQAEDWEKVMTPEVEAAIISQLTGPLTCPHGNPIPGTESPVAWSELRSVKSLEPGQKGKLTRLLEDVELNHDVLKYLEEHNLMPGRDLEVTEIAPDGTITLDVEGARVGLGQALANNLWVLPA